MAVSPASLPMESQGNICSLDLWTFGRGGRKVFEIPRLGHDQPLLLDADPLRYLLPGRPLKISGRLAVPWISDSPTHAIHWRSRSG